MKRETENWYQKTIPYYAVKGGEKVESKIVVTGFNDMFMLTTSCNGKQYSKLFKVKAYKTLTPDEALQKDMQKQIDHLIHWMVKYRRNENRTEVTPMMWLNGHDFYEHDIKAGRMVNGMPLEGWFEMQLEAFMYGNEYSEDEEWLEMLWAEDDRCFG